MPPILAGTEAARKRAQAGARAKNVLASINPVRHLIDIQRVLMKKLENDKLTAMEVAQLTRGYVDAEKLKRIIRGLPANTSQSIREPKEKRRRTPTGPIAEAPEEPIESAPSTPTVQQWSEEHPQGNVER